MNGSGATVPSARHTRASRTDVLYRRRSNTGGLRIAFDPAGLTLEQIKDGQVCCKMLRKGGCYETSRLEANILDCRRCRLRNFRFRRLVAKPRSPIVRK